jgi:hypothetical protein
MKRIKELLAKITSVKGVVFVTATVAMFCGKLDSMVWFFSGVLWVSARLLEKIFVKKE